MNIGSRWSLRSLSGKYIVLGGMIIPAERSYEEMLFP